MALAVASSCNSELTPSLGTSVHHRAGKKERKKGRKRERERERKKEEREKEKRKRDKEKERERKKGGREGEKERRERKKNYPESSSFSMPPLIAGLSHYRLLPPLLQ